MSVVHVDFARRCIVSAPVSQVKVTEARKPKRKSKAARMAEIAKATGLCWDGGDDDRLFQDDDDINVYAHMMTEAEYDAMETDMADYEIKGPGFTVYAWNDSSGHRYWKREGENGSPNYIKVTATISAPGKVDPQRLLSAIADAEAHFGKYDNTSEYHSSCIPD